MKHNLQLIYFREILIVKLIILVEGLIGGKMVFEIFLIDHCAVDVRNKNNACLYCKYMYQFHPPYTMQVSSHRVLYLYFLGTYNICIIDMHVVETCFKIMIATIYFSHSESSSNIMKNVFNSISTYS